MIVDGIVHDSSNGSALQLSLSVLISVVKPNQNGVPKDGHHDVINGSIIQLKKVKRVLFTRPQLLGGWVMLSTG